MPIKKQLNIADQLKNSYESLKLQNKHLRFLSESVPHKIFTVRPTGEVDYYNQAWTEYMYPLPEGMRKRDIFSLMQMHPDDISKNREAWEDSRLTGERFHQEQRLKRFDGEYRWHLTRIFPIRDDDDRITMWAGSTMDINYQKQLSERKDEFIAMASHELKTPVTSLTIYAQMLENKFKKKGDEESAEVLGRMVAQLNKLTILVSDLLDVSKIQAGKIMFNQKVFQLEGVVREVIKNVQSTSDQHTIFIKNMVQARIYGDRDRIGQVIINLLTNAIKYSPKSNKAFVSVKKTKKEAIVSVKDFGIGINNENKDKIFERFFRASNLPGGTYPGLGIGLYISSEIATRHGGRITLTSKKGRGSVFSLVLPLYKHE